MLPCYLLTPLSLTMLKIKTTIELYTFEEEVKESFVKYCSSLLSNMLGTNLNCDCLGVKLLRAGSTHYRTKGALVVPNEKFAIV